MKEEIEVKGVVEAEEIEMDRGRSAISIYMQQMNSITAITAEEGVELGKMLKNPKHRQEAIDRLVEGNLRLVVKMAHDWKGIGLGIDDLIAEGNIALMTAAQKFDIDCGKSFSTYAIWWIRSQMSRAINKAQNVRIPVASEMKKRQVKRFIEDFQKKFDKEPTFEEISEGMGLSALEVKNVFKCENTMVSMNQKFDDSDSDSDEIGEFVVGEQKSVLDDIIQNEEIENLLNAIEQLDEREKIVIKMRFGIGGNEVATLEDVSNKVGRTRERVRQIERTAVQKLAKIMQKISD